MSPHEIEQVEERLRKPPAPLWVCQSVRAWLCHTLELQAFVTALTDHYAAPGPTPEKTAAHYQLMARAKALRARFEANPGTAYKERVQ